MLGIVSALHLHGAAPDRRPLLHRRPGDDNPADRHQRRSDWHLAALLVAGRAPPAAGLLPATSALSDALVHDPLLLRLAILLLAPGETDFLGNLYSFGAMLSFTIAHVSIVALRLREPDAHRPYRAPWNFNWRGKPVPLTAILGALGTAPLSSRSSSCTPRRGSSELAG